MQHFLGLAGEIQSILSTTDTPFNFIALSVPLISVSSNMHGPHMKPLWVSIPVVVYMGASLNQETIANAHRNMAVVYQWFNLITGDVGSGQNAASRPGNYTITITT